MGVLEGGCLGRGGSFLTPWKPREPRKPRDEILKTAPFQNTTISSLSKNHKHGNPRDVILKTTPWPKPPPFGAPNWMGGQPASSFNLLAGRLVREFIANCLKVTEGPEKAQGFSATVDKLMKETSQHKLVNHISAMCVWLQRKQSPTEPEFQDLQLLSNNELGLLLGIPCCETTNYHRINSKTAHEKGNGNFRRVPKIFTDGNGNLHHGTNPSNWILEPQFTDPTFCRNLNGTPLTHPTLGYVFNAQPLENPARCHKFQTMTVEHLTLLLFHCNGCFQHNDSWTSHVMPCLQCDDSKSHVL